MSNQVFKVLPYQINTLELFRDYVKFLQNEDSFQPPISKQTYFDRIRSAVILYGRNQGFLDEYTELAKKYLFYIDCDHPGFMFWLALKISIIENYEIPLMLDSFIKRTKMSSNQFVNKIEFELLKEIISHNIFHNIDAKKIEIANWIREQRKIIDPNKTSVQLDQGECKTLYYNRRSLPFIEKFVDEFAGLNLLVEDEEIDKTDDRFHYDHLTTEEIRSYFMQLNRKNNKGEVILEKEEVEHLLANCFQGFEVKSRRLLEPKISKSALMKFVYVFYRDFDGKFYGRRQMEYCRLLKNNFNAFKDDKIENISKKLATANPKYYPFTS